MAAIVFFSPKWWSQGLSCWSTKTECYRARESTFALLNEVEPNGPYNVTQNGQIAFKINACKPLPSALGRGCQFNLFILGLHILQVHVRDVNLTLFVLGALVWPANVRRVSLTCLWYVCHLSLTDVIKLHVSESLEHIVGSRVVIDQLHPCVCSVTAAMLKQPTMDKMSVVNYLQTRVVHHQPIILFGSKYAGYDGRTLERYRGYHGYSCRFNSIIWVIVLLTVQYT